MARLFPSGGHFVAPTRGAPKRAPGPVYLSIQALLITYSALMSPATTCMRRAPAQDGSLRQALWIAPPAGISSGPVYALFTSLPLPFTRWFIRAA
jgi:hypothetical protein